MKKTKTYTLVTNENVQKPGVVFETSIDCDGDLLVKANGVKVFYVDCESGRLRRFRVTNEQEQAGVSFDATNAMTVYDIEEDM